ncbi:MAG TPA: alpha-amylase [Fibrobacteria bacterium]|nr:alpha-amylase [Fibrobacteria bacterium]
MAKLPLLYQINTRVTLAERSRELGRPATLDDLPDTLLDSLADQGYRWVWFLGLWQTGEAGRRVSLTHAGLRKEVERTLPDLVEADITGSPFAILAYRAHADFGGDAALARLRMRMAKRGLGLMGDFVVNHGAPDHPWLRSRPEWFIRGTGHDLASAPGDWTRLPMGPLSAEGIVAHGKDPYFPGWRDTVQFNLRHPGCREALMGELLKVAARCDAVRCDMAMLAQPDVFHRTWGDRSLPGDGALPVDRPFWPEAIARAKRLHPGFFLIAEVYWDREAELQAEGFDATYDKGLYDCLRRGRADGVRECLRAPLAFQERSLRFLENHDEPRAADVFPPDMHRAAALITFLSPGLRLVHDGQTEGRRVKVSMHLGRRPVEALDPAWETFYARLLGTLGRAELREGPWALAPALPAWEGNPTHGQFVVFVWNRLGLPGLLAVINYGPHRGQCHVRLDTQGFVEESLRFRDLLSDAYYVREARDLAGRGMFFDMPAWGCHLFEIL